MTCNEPFGFSFSFVPQSSRRYYLSGRPCPNDGIIKPTASLEKKQRGWHRRGAGLVASFRLNRFTIILIISYKPLIL